MNTIDYKQVWKSIYARKQLYVKILCITFILASLWIFPQPREYQSTVSLAPEMSNSLGSDAISSFASTFGLDVGGLQNNDAIYPTLYPEILKSSSFIVSLFEIKVTTDDGKLTTTYYDYLQNHHKENPYLMPYYGAMKWIESQTTPKNGKPITNVDPFKLTKKQFKVVRKIGESIECKVDKKTNVITINVTDQDAYISACMADTIRQRLQDYITDYRTKKARHDLEYYEKLTKQALSEYNQSVGEYSSYQDGHMRTVLESVRSKAKKLERSSEIKYNTYTALNNQLQAAKARLQERTPAFTIIQPAIVPIKPIGPKRVRFVLLCMLLAFAGTSTYILREIVQ